MLLVSCTPSCNTIAKTELGETPEAARALGFVVLLAETEGFEPSRQVLPVCSLSRGVPSTSRPRLQARFGGAMIATPRG